MQAYRIRDWRGNFETSESRRYKALSWVRIPNKHDGKGYSRVAKHPENVSLFCAWSLILQVASKMPERGLLADEDGPLDADDIADQTRFPREIFQQALEVLSQPRIGWLELVELGGDGSVTLVDPEHAQGTPRAHHGQTQGENGETEKPAPRKPCGNTQGTPGADPEPAPATPLIDKSTEQESTEKDKSTHTAREEPDANEPTVDEVIAYGKNRLSDQIPEAYCRHFHGRMDQKRMWWNGQGRLVKWWDMLVDWWGKDRTQWAAGTHPALGGNGKPQTGRDKPKDHRQKKREREYQQEFNPKRI